MLRLGHLVGILAEVAALGAILGEIGVKIWAGVVSGVKIELNHHLAGNWLWGEAAWGFPGGMCYLHVWVRHCDGENGVLLMCV